MQIVPLQQVPNQLRTITLDQAKYDISLRTITDVTYATISKNNVKIVDSVRCVPMRPLLPYAYLEGTGGNFAFYTSGDEMPNYTAFGVSHILLYASAAELAAVRASGV